MNIVSGLDDQDHLSYTLNSLAENNDNKSEIIQLIKKLDLGIEEIRIKGASIKTGHEKFDNKGNISIKFFDLDNQESEGTKKIISIAGLLVDTLKYGRLLIFDKFDARLYPLVGKAIVELFNSKKTNFNNAQLIFMTHDTNLLSNKLFRKDQIWFTEKNKYGATDLYSLVEYKIPNDAFFKSDYIKGRYGAIPFIGDLSQILGEPDA